MSFFSINNIRVSFVTVFYFIQVVVSLLELLGSPRPSYSYSVAPESEVVALFLELFYAGGWQQANLPGRTRCLE